jgi:hypothetical protein
VCLLPRWQKPEDTFKTPTYIIGGSDSSHTRQGGINKIILLAAMVLRLLGISNKGMHRENNRLVPLQGGNTIDENINIFSILTVFSRLRALSKP